jgi:hypothetical protein
MLVLWSGPVTLKSQINEDFIAASSLCYTESVYDYGEAGAYNWYQVITSPPASLKLGALYSHGEVRSGPASPGCASTPVGYLGSRAGDG